MIPVIRAIGERIIEEKSPLVTIKDVPVIANKIEMSSRPEGRLCFTKCERKVPKFIYGDISLLKNNDSISLFFIVLYF